MARKPTDEVGFRLRFDELLRRRIEKAAEQNNQSMNAEIIDRLERSFAQEDTTKLIKQVAETTVLAHIKEIRSVIKRGVKISGPIRAEVLVSALARSGYNKAELQTLLPIFEKEGLVRMSSADRKVPAQSQGKSTTQDVEANERVTEMPAQRKSKPAKKEEEG
jgi:hypothetical protein